jgi:hypothetical protein
MRAGRCSAQGTVFTAPPARHRSLGSAIRIALMRSWPRRAFAMINSWSNNAARGGRIAGGEAILHGLVVPVVPLARRHQFFPPPDC